MELPAGLWEKMDPRIRNLVLVLYELDLPTLSSCEGHTLLPTPPVHTSTFPYVAIKRRHLEEELEPSVQEAAEKGEAFLQEMLDRFNAFHRDGHSWKLRWTLEEKQYSRGDSVSPVLRLAPEERENDPSPLKLTELQLSGMRFAEFLSLRRRYGPAAFTA